VVDHSYYNKIFSVFTSRCLVAAFKDGRSPFTGFSKCPRPQLPASHFSQQQPSTDSTTQNQSQGCFTSGGFAPIRSSWRQAPRDSRPDDSFQVNPCCSSSYVTSSLTRGCISLFVKCKYRTKCMWLKFFLVHYKQVFCQSRLCKADHVYLTYHMLQRQLCHLTACKLDQVKSKSKLCCDRRSVGQSVLVSSTRLGLRTRFLLLSDTCGFVDVGRPLWQTKRFCRLQLLLVWPAQSFLGPSLAGLIPVFYCLRIEKPPTGGPGPHIFIPQEEGGPVILHISTSTPYFCLYLLLLPLLSFNREMWR
jgi:hypothetical protein